jgi:hypothetical protein
MHKKATYPQSGLTVQACKLRAIDVRWESSGCKTNRARFAKRPSRTLLFFQKMAGSVERSVTRQNKKSEALLCWDQRRPPPSLPLFDAWSPCPSGPAAGARAAPLRLGGRSLRHAPVAGATRPLCRSSRCAAPPRCLEPRHASPPRRRIPRRVTPHHR